MWGKKWIKLGIQQWKTPLKAYMTTSRKEKIYLWQNQFMVKKGNMSWFQILQMEGTVGSSSLQEPVLRFLLWCELYFFWICWFFVHVWRCGKIHVKLSLIFPIVLERQYISWMLESILFMQIFCVYFQGHFQFWEYSLWNLSIILTKLMHIYHGLVLFW